MGYWEEEYKNKKVLLSDEGLDICFDAVEKFCERYKRDLDREPILEEFLATLVTVMNTNGDSSFTELVDKRIVEIKATTRKAKSIAKVVPGAVIKYLWIRSGSILMLGLLKVIYQKIKTMTFLFSTIIFLLKIL
ncbi:MULTISPECIES: hypothetical protein [Bacillus]|uniref:Uncharacterized protein n=2 Tax=Bacillus amyloliquefaciens group TaxID=1938374 RepID=A0A7W4QHT3_BACVE|nr:MULTISPECIES: hypothetical protein [Bacillus]ASB55225.1 hypothetical protein S100072_03920 [Bacillus velezensis]ASB67739.1 hypothetical protein S101413_04323 [Bacillus velezensis]ERH54751.1 hypothetical protein O205_09510 [Bacillus amyloliquefaciens EGD-AQ14]MCA1231001.1 hypothetical protein [Bacillus velezensis]MCA1309101.1 hypothetical protein [Bacillus velezensis]